MVGDDIDERWHAEEKSSGGGGGYGGGQLAQSIVCVCRLSADSAALRSEQQAILQRAVQRDKTDHFTQLGTLASQKHSYE